nr:hypothetical protein [Tanacetum cinerariifolium]
FLRTTTFLPLYHFLIHVIYAISCLHICSLSVMLSRISFHVLIRQEDKNFDPIPKTPKESKEKSNDEEEQESRLSEEARIQEEETSEEEEGSFDPIPRTPEDSEKESNNEEEQESRLSEEARIQEEEDADKLYRDVNINQGRGLQVTQNVEDTHVTLTPVNPDGPQESSSMSSFVSSMLNPISDVGVESIFTTTSSPFVSLKTPTPIITPSTIATITTSGEAPIPPPTIPSIILENLLTFNLAFRFEERLRLLETSFSEYRQANQFVDAVSAIPGIVHQYMDQQMKEAVREAKVLKGLVKNQVNEQVSRILPRIEESVNGTFEAEVLTRSSYSSSTSYAIAADLSEMELKKILIEKMEGNESIQRFDEQRNLYKALTTCQMEETPHPVYETGADDQPIVQ